MNTHFRLLPVVHKLLIVNFVSLNILGCARCPSLYLHSNKSIVEIERILQERMEYIIENIDPNEIYGIKSTIDSLYEIRIKVMHKGGKIENIRIHRYYKGGGDFLNWATRNRYVRDITVELKEIDSNAEIKITDCISDNAILFYTGHTFADALLLIINADNDGNVALKYENGSIYSQGFLKGGKREGEWLWKWPTGELMQKMAFKNGIFYGMRTITRGKPGSLTEYDYVFTDGIWKETKIEF